MTQKIKQNAKGTKAHCRHKNIGVSFMSQSNKNDQIAVNTL